jgi:hypothetical protein
MCDPERVTAGLPTRYRDATVPPPVERDALALGGGFADPLRNLEPNDALLPNPAPSSLSPLVDVLGAYRDPPTTFAPVRAELPATALGPDPLAPPRPLADPATSTVPVSPPARPQPTRPGPAPQAAPGAPGARPAGQPARPAARRARSTRQGIGQERRGVGPSRYPAERPSPYGQRTPPARPARPAAPDPWAPPPARPTKVTAPGWRPPQPTDWRPAPARTGYYPPRRRPSANDPARSWYPPGQPPTIDIRAEYRRGGLLGVLRAFFGSSGT